MKISLLSQNAEIPKETLSLYDLSIDRSIAKICKNSRRTDYFLKILQTPLQNEDNIYYRREIIADFKANANLAEKLKFALTRYDKLKSDWLEMKNGEGTKSFDVSNDVLLEQIYASLKVTAMFPNTVLSLYKTISEQFDGCEIKSRGLLKLREHCEKMRSDETFSDVVKIASKFLYNNARDYDFELCCDFDRKLNIAKCSVCGIEPHREKKKLLIFKQKSESEAAYPNILSENGADDAKGILCTALGEIDDLLYKITESVYESLYSLSYEMDFYLCALDVCEFFNNSGYEYCYPEISREPSLICNTLRDVFLVSGNTTETVYPVDVSISGENSSLIITGGNGTGKTTFLRAVGAAQIFCQAGLPVLCKSAVISIRNGVYSHFSSEEEAFRENDTSGRFESEVAKVSKIIDSVLPNSLVLFNETFQTTSYREGSRAIIDILRAFSKIGTQYIFVTHLPGVATALKDKAKSMKTVSENGKFGIK